MLVSTAISPKKRVLIDTACTLFRQKGYHGASMRDLAKAMGIEAASLYNHIQSKQEILHFVCFDIAKKFDRTMLTDNPSAKELLSNAIKNHIYILLENVNASYVFTNEWKNLDEEDLLIFNQKRKRYQKYYEELIQHGNKEGKFNQIDPKFGAIAILSTLNGIMDWYKPTGKIKETEIIEKTTKILLRGVMTSEIQPSETKRHK